MARLYEYQGKQILKEIGVAVPEGDVASTPQEARAIAEQIGKLVAVKAQIWATGRFKAGGIKFADDPDGAEKAAGELLGAEVKGFPVPWVQKELVCFLDLAEPLGCLLLVTDIGVMAAGKLAVGLLDSSLVRIFGDAENGVIVVLKVHRLTECPLQHP